MKKNNIEKVISKKINEWLDSIEDETLRDSIEKNIVVTGGCIVSLLNNEKPNDYDVYFTNKETVLKVAKYYTNKFNEKNPLHLNKINRQALAWVLDGEDVEKYKKGELKITDFACGYNSDTSTLSGMILNTAPERVKIIINSDGIAKHNTLEINNEDVDKLLDTNKIEEYLEETIINDDGNIFKNDDKNKYIPLFISSNAITLSNGIQLVIRFYGKPEEILKTYDFLHCTSYWESSTKKIVWNAEILESIINKQLKYLGSEYPICSVIRTRKFINRGWKINAGQYLKMAFQISKLDLEDINVLEDQLIGVDSLYFSEAISNLRRMQENNPDVKFDNTYICSIIDKIFN